MSAELGIRTRELGKATEHCLWLSHSHWLVADVVLVNFTYSNVRSYMMMCK